MKSIIINEPFDIGIKEIERPNQKAGYAIIEVKALGVCGSDVHAYSGKSPNVNYPIIIGHETAGVVVDIEENTFGIQKGDKVVLDPYLHCGSCYPCSQGRTNCCEELKCLGVQTSGSMSEYFAHPISQLIKMNEGMSWEHGAVVEPLVIALHAIHNCELKASEHIVIIGGGTIGLLSAMAAKAYGGIPILVDLVQERLEMAKSFGIEHTVNPKEVDPVSYIKEITKGRMSECVIEASGASAGVKSTLDYAAATGRIALTGWTNQPVELPTALITRKELQIRGSRTGLKKEFEEAISLISTGKVPAWNIISKVTTLEKLPEDIVHLHENPGDYIKVIALIK